MRQLKASDEGVRLRIDDADDLWTLAQICRVGANLGMLSHRRDSTTGTQEGGRSKSAERKPMWIEIEVSECAFQPFTDNLRVHGIISEARSILAPIIHISLRPEMKSRYLLREVFLNLIEN